MNKTDKPLADWPRNKEVRVKLLEPERRDITTDVTEIPRL